MVTVHTVGRLKRHHTSDWEIPTAEIYIQRADRCDSGEGRHQCGCVVEPEPDPSEPKMICLS